MNDNEKALLNVFDKIGERAANAIHPDTGDYEIDGLLYCCKCDTPKQKKLSVFGEDRTVYCLCKCAADRYKAEEEERKRRDFMIRVDKLRHQAFSEERMRGWTFANDDKKNERISNAALKYVENWEQMRENGKGLLLFGNTGTGKTYMASCIANALIDRGIACVVTNFARIGATLQGMFAGKQEYLDDLNRVPLLVIDDLGVERNSDYMQEIVYNVVDARCRAGMPLIVTTNLTSEELKKAENIQHRRIYSRLFECCIPIEVAGADRRRLQLKDEHEQYSDLLGL